MRCRRFIDHAWHCLLLYVSPSMAFLSAAISSFFRLLLPSALLCRIVCPSLPIPLLYINIDLSKSIFVRCVFVCHPHLGRVSLHFRNHFDSVFFRLKNSRIYFASILLSVELYTPLKVLV